MEFNAGIFSFTGTRSNPLNMLRLRLLTLTALARDAGRAPGRRPSRNFLYQYQWLVRFNSSVRRLFVRSRFEKIQAQTQGAGSRIHRDAGFLDAGFGPHPP